LRLATLKLPENFSKEKRLRGFLGSSWIHRIGYDDTRNVRD
jgi:hypothetical protein